MIATIDGLVSGSTVGCDSGARDSGAQGHGDDLVKLSQEMNDFLPRLEEAAVEAQAVIDEDNKTAGARQPLPGKEAKASQLETAILHGTIDSRGPLGQSFRAWLSANPKVQAEFDDAVKHGPGKKREQTKHNRISA